METGPPFYAVRAKAVPSFLIYFKTLSIGPIPGIEPANSRSADKHFTDRANTAVEDESKIQFERVHRIVTRTASSNPSGVWAQTD